MADGGRLGKLKSKLAELSDNIDKADERKAEAKANILEAEARLEKAEAEVSPVNIARSCVLPSITIFQVISNYWSYGDF